jgi:Flp pilus assembly pilin Flp
MSMLRTYPRDAFGRLCHDEAGAVESAQIFAWIAVTVVAIMALGLMMQALGVDVINWVRDQIFAF